MKKIIFVLTLMSLSSVASAAEVCIFTSKPFELKTTCTDEGLNSLEILDTFSEMRIKKLNKLKKLTEKGFEIKSQTLRDFGANVGFEEVYTLIKKNQKTDNMCKPLFLPTKNV